MKNNSLNISSKYEELVESNNYIKEDLIVLKTQKESLENDVKKMTNTVLENSFFLNINPEIMDFLDKFSKRSYEENLENYQRLLSYYVNDVFMSKNVEEKEILIELVEKINSLAIDIYIQNKGSNNREDIVKSNGGGMANIIAVGLKVLSLFNLNLANGYRKFLVLDEADCWLKEPDGAKNEAFYKQLYEISKHCNMQIFIISHWDIPLSIPAKRVHLSLDNNKVIHVENKTVIDDDLLDSDEDYIRKISLKNFESHKNTTIELSPRITILTGDNNIGKSAIVRAFRSAFYFDGSDLQINHEANEAKVYVEFNDEQSLLWTRKRKGNVPEEYLLNIFNKDGKYSITNQVNEAIHLKFSKKKMMETGVLGEIFGIYKYNNLDLQLGDQKDPIGILKLDSKDKAMALFSDINFKFYKKLSETHKQKYREKQIENTLNNKKIAENEKKVEILNDLKKIEKINLKELEKNIKELKEIENLLNRFELLNNKNDILKSLNLLKENDFHQIKRNIEEQKSKLIEISELYNKYYCIEKKVVLLDQLSSINIERYDFNENIGKLSNINEYINKIKQLNDKKNEYNKNIKSLYEIYFNQKIDKLFEIKKEQNYFIHLSKLMDLFEKMPQIDVNYFKENEIKEKINELIDIKNKGDDLVEKNKVIKKTDKEIKKLRDSLNELKSEMDELSKIICPLCRRPFNNKHEHTENK